MSVLRLGYGSNCSNAKQHSSINSPSLPSASVIRRAVGGWHQPLSHAILVRPHFYSDSSTNLILSHASVAEGCCLPLACLRVCLRGVRGRGLSGWRRGGRAGGRGGGGLDGPSALRHRSAFHSRAALSRHPLGDQGCLQARLAGQFCNNKTTPSER